MGGGVPGFPNARYVLQAADLAALDAAGVPAVLVASALHDGRLADC